MLYPLISYFQYDLAFTFHKLNVGRDNSVSIATSYELNSPGIEFR
jgi:hypothetical protein